MAFIYGERLIEFAIRVGTDDIMDNPEFAELLFHTNTHENQGKDLTPPGASTPIKEPLPFDFFQKRIAEIPRRKTETGQSGNSIFKNSIPEVQDIKEYLQKANIRIMHGYPRETKDLPAISITLGNEGEGQKYLGTMKQTIQGATSRYEIHGSDFNAAYSIMIITPNYDETVIWYHIIRYCLLRYRTALEGYGLREQHMEWLPTEPAPEYLQAGHFIYQRPCMFSCVKDEDFPVEVDRYKEFAAGVTTTTGSGQPDQSGVDKTIIPCQDESTVPIPVHPSNYVPEE